jgi:PKHD-type hydroxylase
VLIEVPEVLSREQLAQARELLHQDIWIDGKVTADHQSARNKNNLQLPEDHPVAKQLGELVLESLGRSPLFVAGALPLKVFPPPFNKYQGGQSFGTHVDNAIRQVPGTPYQVRTDLSATLFISSPEEYDGGELVVEDTYCTHSVKLPAGHMILYPSTSLHMVRLVTRGARIASFFWIQSTVKDDGLRMLLFDLDLAIQRINKDVPEHPSTVQLTGVYHNLLRGFAEV